MANDNPAIWALLVGIDSYRSPSVPQLSGCRNDVEAVRMFLINHLNVPSARIKTLTDDDATRENIITAFKSFLIENRGLPRDSQILFHYSGHGSQMRDTTGREPDGLDETIVPHDSRTGSVFDIPDKTIGGLIDNLAAAKGENITVILDCCHSGSGTRAMRTKGSTPTRRAPADDRLPPGDLDAGLHPGAATRGAGPSGWALTRPNHVLLAGCLDREESHEHDTPEGITHGALTYFALQYLRQMATGATYADWHASVKAQVRAHYTDQTPQCEGQRNRAVFGGAYVERDPFIVIKEVRGDTVTFESGLVHGVHPGTELAIYTAGVTKKRDLPTPIAQAQVKSVTATTAMAGLINAPVRALPPDSHALVTHQAYAGIRQRVALTPKGGARDMKAIGALREDILNAAGPSKPSPYLELMADPDRHADLRVTAEKGELSIRDDAGKLLVLPQDFQQRGATTVRQALESISRYRTIVELANRQHSKLEGKFSLRLRRCVDGAACTSAEDLPADAGGDVTIEYDPDQPDRNCYVVDVRNDSPIEAYPHIFVLNPDYSIYRLYPAAGQNEALKPGRTLSSGLPGSGGSALDISLPGDKEGEDLWDISHEQIKLILTSVPTDLGLLTQEKLSVPAQRRTARASPLEQLLGVVTSGVATRGKPITPGASEDWGTAEFPYTVVRASRAQTLGAAKARVSLDDDITLEKPQGFEGRISVAPLEQARRGITGEPSLKLPPGLSRLSEVFQPISRRGTRGMSGQPLVITLETDEFSRALITPDNPLRLKFPEELGADDMLAVAFDGEDYLPVGYAPEPGAVDIICVPQVVANSNVPGTPTRRGIGRAIKLFVFKKLGRQLLDVGLRYLEGSNGDAAYRRVEKDRFRPGDRVAVFVHGFLSDTTWMARDVAPFLRREVLPYEHVLTWDYETFGTSVQSNGEDFATALRQQCGCGPADGLTVHIYAHSMGSLVSRCMVELAGGHEFVDRVVLAGPPNRGTTLATLSRGSIYLLSALVNNVGAVPLAGGAKWLTKELYEQGQGWRDLAVDSDVSRRLNSLAAPSNVPYLALAGVNTLNQTQGGRLNRLAHKLLDRTLDAVFGETENDAVIGMSSMEGMRNGTYPALTFAKLSCDHFNYFAIAEGQAAVKQWIH